MAHPVATLFALSMAIWVADARFTPAPAQAPVLSACQSGFSTSAPSDADVELVVCGARNQ